VSECAWGLGTLDTYANVDANMYTRNKVEEKQQREEKKWVLIIFSTSFRPGPSLTVIVYCVGRVQRAFVALVTVQEIYRRFI